MWCISCGVSGVRAGADEVSHQNGAATHPATTTAIDQPVSAAVITDQRIAHTSGARSFLGSIKQLFRDVKQVLTGKEPAAPQPKRTRRRGGETLRGFIPTFAVQMRIWSKTPRPRR